MDVWTWPADRYYYGWYDTPPGAVGPPATDGQIKSEAVDRLRKNPYTAECELQVDVKRGVVILRGAVPDRRAKRSAGDDCWDILGVRDVSNQLEVAEGQGDAEGIVADVMSAPALMAFGGDPLARVASMMRDNDIGFVVVVDDNGVPTGVVTDRDIVTRAVADGAAPTQAVQELVTVEPAAVDQDEPIGRAVALMRSYSVRRLPVVHDGSVVGVVSLGDLARVRDPGSVLADISAAPPDD
jgi:CBS domain-containing protein